MELYIKNMVCPRCIQAVKTILDDLHIHYHSVVLGCATIQEIDERQRTAVQERLQQIGFELLDDPRSRTVE